VARRSDIGLIEVDQALCGRNATRKQVNDLARSSTGWTDPMPVKGDRLVCLRNNKRKGTFNGTLGSVARVLGLDGSFILRDFESDEGASSKVSVHRAFFEGTDHRMSPEKRAKLFDQFVYGYALTVHKAQGSQWDHVLVLDESACFREDSARWLYTAVTRAAKRLTLAMQ
jgi:exodeoxyribonuclease V